MLVTATTSAPLSFGLSGFSGDACLTGVYVIFMVTTCLAAFVNGYAAFLNFRSAESVKVVADRVRIPRWWMAPLGTLLAFGAVGLLAGFAVPVLGAAAASGLVLYFVCAVTAHFESVTVRSAEPLIAWTTPLTCDSAAVSISLRKLLARVPVRDVNARTDGYPFDPKD